MILRQRNNFQRQTKQKVVRLNEINLYKNLLILKGYTNSNSSINFSKEPSKTPMLIEQNIFISHHQTSIIISLIGDTNTQDIHKKV